MFTDRSRTFAGLLLCLTCAEMICEGKTFRKKLIEMDRLGEDGQVRVQTRGTDKTEMVAQYFCDKSICTVNFCDKCFENQSGYLVLILHNISLSDQFDAFLNSEKKPFEEKFTLDEDVPSTTTAVPDETPTLSIKPTDPPHTTKMPETPPGEALSTEAKGGIGAGVCIVIAAVAYEVYARITGRDGIIAMVVRRIFAREPDKDVGNRMEKESFVPNNRVKRRSKSVSCDIL